MLAHETSHIANNDIQFMMVAVVFAGAIGLFAAALRNVLWFGAGDRDNRNGGLMLVAIAVGILAPLIALLVRLAISRKREYMADANGARMIRDSASLAKALKKIEKYSDNPNTAPMQNANEITAALYISNPFKAESVMNLFSTHPPLKDRIKKLEQMY
ncbi:Protease HtpX [uncultured archaeon]|nr:Protease HtpX [uncultured archaeon]